MTIPWGRHCPVEGGGLCLSQCSKERTRGRGLATGVEQAQHRLNPCVLSTVLQSDFNFLGSRADLVIARHYFNWFPNWQNCFLSLSLLSVYPPFFPSPSCGPQPLSLVFTFFFFPCVSLMLALSLTSSLLSLSASPRSAGLLPNRPLNDMILKSEKSKGVS